MLSKHDVVFSRNIKLVSKKKNLKTSTCFRGSYLSSVGGGLISNTEDKDMGVHTVIPEPQR